MHTHVHSSASRKIVSMHIVVLMYVLYTQLFFSIGSNRGCLTHFDHSHYCDFIIVHVFFRLFDVLAGAYFFAPDCGINEGSDLLLSDNLFEKSDDE